MRSIGLDLSLTGTGLAEIQTDHGAAPVLLTVTSKGAASDGLEAREHRLYLIVGRVMEFVQNRRPDLVVIEAPAFSKLNGHQHDRSGLWWLVIAALHDAGFPVIQVQPNLRAKYATGKAGDNKDQVLMATTRRYPHLLFANNNEVDAFILAMMGLRILGTPLDDLPKTHLSALDSMGAEIAALRSRLAPEKV